MCYRLWIIGGTEESCSLVKALLARSRQVAQPLSLLVSVTTDSARRLYRQNSGITIWVGQLTADYADVFLKTHNINAILDASHPFAVAVSQLAIATAQRHGLPYLRYERSCVGSSPQDLWRDRAGRPSNIFLPQLADIFNGDYLPQERTLLTLGYRWLAAFAPWQSQGTLFARILPSQTALAAALAAGFSPERIVALRPPISDSLERALWQQWGITQVITKASGKAGGEDRKQAIAAELKIRLIRIARPVITYPAQTDCLETAVQFGLTTTLSLESQQ